jgi:hypothetical protein
MIDFLKLLGGLLVGLFRSHAAREAEMAFLRQQLIVLKRSRSSEAQVSESRSADFRLAVSALPISARGCDHLSARNAGTLAEVARFYGTVWRLC